MTDLIIVGESPLRGHTDPGRALEGSSGRNLARIAGWDWDEYLRRTYRVNLFPDPQDHWPRLSAWSAADELATRFLNALTTPTVVLLGQRVADAFQLGEAPLYDWMHQGWATVARVPHPSGLNRAWNDPAERARAREFLGRLLA